MFIYIYIYFGCWIKSSPEFFLPIILSGHGLPAGHSGSFSPHELSLRNWPWRPEHLFSLLVLVKLIFLGYWLHPRFICSQLTLNCFALVPIYISGHFLEPFFFGFDFRVVAPFYGISTVSCRIFDCDFLLQCLCGFLRPSTTQREDEPDDSVLRLGKH